MPTYTDVCFGCKSFKIRIVFLAPHRVPALKDASRRRAKQTSLTVTSHGCPKSRSYFAVSIGEADRRHEMGKQNRQHAPTMTRGQCVITAPVATKLASSASSVMSLHRSLLTRVNGVQYSLTNIIFLRKTLPVHYSSPPPDTDRALSRARRPYSWPKSLMLFIFQGQKIAMTV